MDPDCEGKIRGVPCPKYLMPDIWPYASYAFRMYRLIKIFSGYPGLKSFDDLSPRLLNYLMVIDDAIHQYEKEETDKISKKKPRR